MSNIQRSLFIALMTGAVALPAYAGTDVSTWRMDKAGYPKAYAAWGEGGFRKINGLMQPAADLIRRSKDCAVFESIGLSDQRSDSKEKTVVFFADCRAQEGAGAFARFYVTEADIQAGRVPISDKASAETVTDAQMKEACAASVMKKRKRGAMKRYPASERVERSPVALGNAMVTVPFDVTDLTFKAACYFHGGKLVETNIEPR